MFKYYLAAIKSRYINKYRIYPSYIAAKSNNFRCDGLE